MQTAVQTLGVVKIAVPQTKATREHLNKRGFLPLKRLVMGRNNESSSLDNAQGCDSHLCDLKCDVLQPFQSRRSEKATQKFLCTSVMQKDINVYNGKTVVSNTSSVHGHPDSSLNWEKTYTGHLLSSGNKKSEHNHFPMFHINQKMERILNPRKRPGYDILCDKHMKQQNMSNMSVSASHVMAFESKKYKFPAQKMTQNTNEDKELYRSSKGILSHQNNFARFSSQFEVHRVKCNGPSMSSCSCRDGEDISSSSQHLVGHSVSTDSEDLEHALCNLSSHRDYVFSEVRTEEERIVKSPTSRRGSRLQGSNLGKFSTQFLHREHVMGLAKDSNQECDQEGFPKSIRFNDINSLDNQLHKKSCCSCSFDDMNTQRMNSMGNLREKSYTLCDSYDCKFSGKGIANTLACGKQLIANSTGRSKDKRSSLYEMLTSASVCLSHGERKNGEVHKEDCIACNDQLRAQNESCAKTKTMNIESGLTLSSIPSVDFSGTHKEAICPNSPKADSAAASPSKQAISRANETQSLDTNTELPDYSEKVIFVNNIASSTSKTMSMSTNNTAHYMEEPKSINSDGLLEASTCFELGSSWVKRLKQNHSGTYALSAKRMKARYDPINGESTSSLFSRVFNYSRSSTDLVNHLKEKQIIDDSMTRPSDCQFSSGLSTKCVHSWVERWFHSNNSQVTPEQASLATKLPSVPENCVAVPENLSGQFPSIKAMAMMGNAMNKSPPCEFQRRGPVVVWNTEEC